VVEVTDGVTAFVDQVARPLFSAYHLDVILPALLIFVVGWLAVRMLIGMGK